MSEILTDSRTFEEDRDIISGLKCSAVSDTTDELMKCREYLSQGDIIFIYKNSKDRETENTLYEVCIRVHNQYTIASDNITQDLDEYIVEIYTKDYSVIYPHVPRTYLDVELYDILESFKVPKDILITYKQIIEDLKV